MSEDDVLSTFGFPPAASDAYRIRSLLRERVILEENSSGGGCSEVMRLLCAQLFTFGDAKDAALIWRAKKSSMDANASIEIELLCGAGVEETRSSLSRARDHYSTGALKAVCDSVSSGQLADFSVSEFTKNLVEYFRE